MTTSRHHAALRTALCAAAAAVLSLAATTTATADGDRSGGWKGEGGLTLTSAQNNAVDSYLAGARRAERTISVQVRAAASLTGAELVGFDKRLKSPDSLKRKVAGTLVEQPGRNVASVLAGISDAVRYTLQWDDTTYTSGVTRASGALADWANESTKWSNTWGRTSGYKGLNTGWRAPRSGQLFEVQFHTPASKHAQEATHTLYEEQRLPSTSPERKRELQREQDSLFAAVPVPAGAESLTAPAPRRAPVPASA
ncbi:ATP nucleotide 3'-pyrophosphokinase [Streptomyces sp. SID11385]|uniref:ATP nucleotide 3'-pyrophosphokinase n=1 Tax=Streptomyces sp. SID11385 TaxID=2706031 RepID=UPI0013C71A95|nr:ATP nucleotide 3'-pyrophosphokinase [Streptomyces sp. SID11385]NEA40115.1 ATP nucleotide 3'-pyrophosphokinase [Streptomyces sp. SID11385]